MQGEDTIPTELAQVEVGSEEFVFDPTEVETIRPDLFNPGFFSTFDVLVHRELRWIPVSLLAGGKRIAARRGKSVCLSRAFSWITAAWAYKG